MTNLSDSNPDEPAKRNTQASKAEQDRQQRLNKALRENLSKRKRQTRFRRKHQKAFKDHSGVKIKGKVD